MINCATVPSVSRLAVSRVNRSNHGLLLAGRAVLIEISRAPNQILAKVAILKYQQRNKNKGITRIKINVENRHLSCKHSDESKIKFIKLR